MAEMTAYEAGTPSWAELATTDAEGARSFYTELFGWDVRDTEAGRSGTYSMCLLRDQPVAAFYEMDGGMRERGVPAMWLTYVSVDDLDDAAGKVDAAGGSLHAEPFDVADAGRMALVQDPTDAMLALWQGKEHAGAGIVNEPGTMVWNELASSDPDAALGFYGELFGWTATAEELGGEPYHTLKLGERPVAGALPREALPEGVPSHWTVYFAVEDCDAAVEKAKELGAELMFGPTDLPPAGRTAALKDPQGAVFSIVAPGDGAAQDEEMDKGSEDESEDGPDATKLDGDPDND